MLARFLAMTVVGFIVTALGHVYLFQRLVEPLMRDSDRTIWISVFVALWGLTFFGFPLLRIVPAGMRRGVKAVLFGWMGVAYVSLLLCALTFPLTLFVRFSELDPAALSTFVGFLCVGVSAYAFCRALAPAKVTPCEIPVRADLPEGVEKLKVVLLSDIHVSGLIGRRRIRKLVQTVNGLAPDLILISGDLVDGSVSQLEAEVEPFVEMKAPGGVHYVTGNHEYYSGHQRWRRHLQERFGWNVLVNASCALNLGEVGVNLIGIEDRSWLAVQKPEDRRDLRFERATELVTPESAACALNVLLAHQPKDARRLGHFPWIDVQLSGHTHGGQLWPLYLFVLSDQGYNKGLYRIPAPEHPARAQALYVNQGTGFWGPPMRLGTHCEVSLLTFKRVGMEAGGLAPVA